ncbi:MAG: nucleoside recognition protein [Deltaproteobacteria bacterium]|nr:nucleoside recognition protein [Deltaproteobacteria bacterium]
MKSSTNLNPKPPSSQNKLIHMGASDNTPPSHTVHKKRSQAFLSILISFLMVVFLLSYAGKGLEFAFHKIGWPVLRMLVLIAIVLAATSLLEAKGYFKWMARLFHPLLRIGRFSAVTASAFTAAFFSGIVANTLLAKAYQDNTISKRELFLANLLNVGFPAYTLHFPTAMAILLPMIGKAGVVYLVLTFLAALLRTVFVLVIARIYRPECAGQAAPPGPCNDDQSIPLKSQAITVNNIWEQLIKRLWRIAIYTVPIYTFVVVLQEKGFFKWLEQSAAHIFTTAILPIEGVSVVVFSIVSEFTAGAAAAGAMLHGGILTHKETVIALLIGNIIATPVRALRHQLPTYLGIFTPGIGMQILLTSQVLRVASIVIVLICYCLLP